MKVNTLEWIGGVDGCLRLLDQRRLPAEEVYIDCDSTGQLYEAILTLAVRGAPAIGAAAGFGLVLACREAAAKDISIVNKFIAFVRDKANYLESSRPTAVNLSWAIKRVLKRAEQFAAEKTKEIKANSKDLIDALRQTILDEAQQIADEDARMCEAIGVNGCGFIKPGSTVLTHCNAGSLATAGEGTALAVMYEAEKRGVDFKVYVDETRPLLQGARLTAWELNRAGIEAVLLCDNASGMLMKQGGVDLIITGADRIAANGDTANKVGTYPLSVLAARHDIPFYIAAPTSTFDMAIDSGDDIPIEQRDAIEVKEFANIKTAPTDVAAYNPAFDVTNARDITAIITEKGLIEKPDKEKIAALLK
jgi:methylthioribose-1-phosphate isomerase